MSDRCTPEELLKTSEIRAVEQAAAALARHDWPAAYHLLDAEVSGTAPSPEALTVRADAAWWLGLLDECITTRERAFAALEARDEEVAAARIAMLLFDNHCFKGRPVIARGWLERARRYLDGLPAVPALGGLHLRDAEVAYGAGAHEAAMAHAAEALRIGREAHDHDLVGDALQCTGRILIAVGKPAEGLAQFDEAMLLAVEGKLGPFVTGKVYCSLISACEELGDFQRAIEWTEAGGRWADTHPFAAFPGLCRVHRADLLQMRGAWAEAEQEARRAYSELCDIHLFNAGSAYYSIGEIRRLLGDHDAAEDAFARADELGRHPQPGLALLRLAQGRTDAAAASVARALAEDTTPLGRAKLLPAQVEIALAAHDVDTAREAAAELDAVAGRYGTPGLLAAADLARGRVALAAGEPDTACGALRHALHHWQALELPYEVASTRVLLGSACRVAGDEDGARACFDAAVAIFQRLGARSDAQRSLALRDAPARPDGPLTGREVEVLRLVASGATNKDIARELVLSEKTVARHLSNIFAKIGVSTRSAATAYAFEQRLVGSGRRTRG